MDKIDCVITDDSISKQDKSLSISENRRGINDRLKGAGYALLIASKPEGKVRPAITAQCPITLPIINHLIEY